MMVQPRRSASCYEIGVAPRADEDFSFVDDYEMDDDNKTDVTSAMSSQRSSVITARSSGAGSRTTLTSRETDSKPSGGRWSRKMVVCRIALLDGTTFEPKEVDKNATGQSVFDKVIKKLDIIETDYFGLTYRDKTGKKFWIDKSKKISKQVKGGTWVFEFQVKFYSPDPMSLKEDITRYQLCLQLRVDIFNGKLPCSFVTYALLGSYTVQGELGDWDPIENGNGIEYLHDFDFAPTQQPELLEKIVELHKHHKGQTPSVAEAHYLENAKKLAMYGVDMHDAKDSNEKDIQLGICANGILIYKDRLRINRFVWPKILKLSYKRNHFYIKVRPDEFDPHEKTIGFQCNSHKLAKRLWKTCVEHHAFFRLKDADPPDSGTLFPRFNTRYRYSGRTAHQARKAAEQENREEPHISRTAERRSMGKDKTKSMDDMAHRHNRPDEEDMHDQKRDPNATLEMGPGGDSATLDRDGRQQGARPEDAADRFDTLHGKNDETAGPGYGDTSALSDGGKKTKKDKEEEKRRRKEEEQRRKDEEKRKKDEEKERKRLEKERKKHPGKHSPETAIDDDLGDAAHLAQSPDKDEKKGGGFFGKFGGKKSPADKSVEEKEGHVEVVVDPIEQQKPKPIVTWALPGMQELMEKQAATNQAALADNVMSSPPRIEIDEVSESGTLEADGTVDADVVTESVCQSESVVENQSQPKGDYSPVIGVKGDDCADPAAAADGELEEAAAVMTEYQVKEDYLQLLRETPDIQRESRYDDIRPLINRDPRFEAVDSEKRREEWFKEYTDDMMKKDFMRLLRETSTIHSQSPWREARLEIDNDPRFQVVPSEAQREEWFNEYVQNLLKSDYMQLLKDTPSIGSTSRWETARYDIELDPRFLAVPGDEQREDWFNEYIQNLKKQEFLDLLHETPDITSYSRYGDVRPDICSDPRFNNVDTETQREQYFNEYLQDLKKAGFTQLLSDTPDITGQSRWYESKHKIDTDPRYHAVDTDLQRAKWFNEYVNNLNGCGYGDGDFGMKIGDYKSIDRTQEFLPLVPPTVAVKKVPEEPMPFFEPAGETDVDALGQRRVPPPVAKKPRAHSGYDSEEDRLLQSGGGVPVTVETESYKYDPDADDAPRSTSNIPFVETKTHKVTYERDGIPYETEDSVLISAHSVTTKSQTIDTTTYKTERDGVIETRIERKITVTSDENDDFDHDALLRAAIEEVTNMNPDLSVEKIECMRQIEGVQQ